MKTTNVMLTLATTLCLWGCSSDNNSVVPEPDPDPIIQIEEPPVTHSYTPVSLDNTQREINQKVNTFSWKLFKEVYLNRNEGDNLMISPISLAVDLGMFINGLEGETLQQVLKTMGLEDYSKAQLNDYFQTMMNGIEKADLAATFKSANAFWYNQNKKANQDFLTTIQTSYNAKAEAVDFADPQTVVKINTWCAEQTNDRIKEMLQETSELDIFHLMNAVYFKACWEKTFDKLLTNKAPFTFANGQTEEVDMMRQTFSTAYAETDKYQQCTKAFVDESFQMVFILPKEGVKLEDVIPETLDFRASALANTADAYEGKPQWEEVALSAPKFTSEYTAEGLFNYMKNLNPNLVLNWEDLSIFEQKEEMLLDAVQKTFFLMDEEGAEAAAITDIAGYALGAPTEPIYMTLNRPFIYAIVETETGCPLFIGYYGK